ncbi:MAG: flavodoxin domain-containing protein [Candidatus Bathyarchaeota archaeon]|nr:flavodoxin domain-containing protein [Candidatus Bathyarchaeota archaeon]
MIVYGTRCGATARTSEIIAETCSKEGLDVKVVNLKEDTVKDINEYELVIVGSGIQINKWTGEPEKFLKKFQKELTKKSPAPFVCCGNAEPIDDRTDKTESIEKARKKYLEEKAVEYNLQPIALGLFGGIYNFNNMPWFFRKTMSAVKPQLEAAGVPQTELGLCDTGDLNALRSWTEEVGQTVQSLSRA